MGHQRGQSPSPQLNCGLHIRSDMPPPVQLLAKSFVPGVRAKGPRSKTGAGAGTELRAQTPRLLSARAWERLKPPVAPGPSCPARSSRRLTPGRGSPEWTWIRPRGRWGSGRCLLPAALSACPGAVPAAAELSPRGGRYWGRRCAAPGARLPAAPAASAPRTAASPA